MTHGLPAMIYSRLTETSSSIIRVVQRHTRRSRVFFTLGELVGTPGPDLLLPVFIAADPSKRIQFHYG